MKIAGLFCAASMAVLAATGAWAAPAPSLDGRWVASVDLHGTRVYETLQLVQKGEALTGKFQGDPLTGEIKGDRIHFATKDDQGGSTEVTGTVAGGKLTAEAISTNADDPGQPDHFSFTAVPVEVRPSGPPKRHEFTPTRYYREFSAFNPPALTIAPGDTVHTTTVDAGGADEKGVTRVLGGNPQTGPFYVTSALPGDTLVIHLNRLKLNRDYAVSDDFIVERAMNSGLAVKQKDAGKTVAWKLDPARGVATLAKPGPHTAGFSVPLRPMLGCIATAASPGRSAPNTGDSGNFGGNMDFNEVVEGATVYLPVIVPGALLYLGDAHAAQGDGELTGNALETSMDVEFTVDVIPGHRINGPRVESATHIMAMGLDGSVDGALKAATGAMSNWLATDYHLTPPEVAALFGGAAEYRISEVADRNAGVVLKIDKARLKGLSAEPAKP